MTKQVCSNLVVWTISEQNFSQEKVQKTQVKHREIELGVFGHSEVLGNRNTVFGNNHFQQTQQVKTFFRSKEKVFRFKKTRQSIGML